MAPESKILAEGEDMTSDRGGQNSPKGREILQRFSSDPQYRADVLANLRAGRYGPDFSFDELSPSEQAFLSSGRWQRAADETRLASMSETEMTWS
jgi:hypothetical protein